MKPFKLCLPILMLIIGNTTFGQTPEQQKRIDKNQKTSDSISQCISLEEALQLANARERRIEADIKAINNETNALFERTKNSKTNPDSTYVFSGDYNDLLTLELASRISGFEASKATKIHTMKGMLAETLRYYWENGREVIKEKSPTNRKRETYPQSDLVQIKWVDGEADMDSFLDFIDLEKYPEKTKVNDVGESAYWNSIKNHLEVYYNGVSFTLQVDISNDENLNKEKTIALARLIIEEQIK